MFMYFHVCVISIGKTQEWIWTTTFGMHTSPNPPQPYKASSQPKGAPSQRATLSSQNGTSNSTGQMEDWSRVPSFQILHSGPKKTSNGYKTNQNASYQFILVQSFHHDQLCFINRKLKSYFDTDGNFDIHVAPNFIIISPSDLTSISDITIFFINFKISRSHHFLLVTTSSTQNRPSNLSEANPILSYPWTSYRNPNTQWHILPFTGKRTEQVEEIINRFLVLPWLNFNT